MNKKFLSAILFGALMVSSTGTFVSCKDYDDDIDNLQTQITANADAIKKLQDLMGQGQYVTGVTKTDAGLVFSMSNGGASVTIPVVDGKDGKDGTLITLDPKTNNWIIDGKDTGICAKGEKGDKGEDGTTGTGVNGHSPKIDEATGCWAVWDDAKQDWVVTDQSAIGAQTYVVSYESYYELNVMEKNAEGENLGFKSVKLPISRTLLSITPELNGQAYAQDFNIYYGILNSDVEWKGHKAVNEKMLAGMYPTADRDIKMLLNPTDVDAAKGYTWSFVSTDNTTPWGLTFGEAKPWAGKATTATRSAASANGLWILPRDVQRFDLNAPEMQGRPDYVQQFKANDGNKYLYALKAVSTVDNDESKAVRSSYVYTFKANNINSVEDIYISGQTYAPSGNSFVYNKEYAPSFDILYGQGTDYDQYAVDSVLVYDYYLEIDKSKITDESIRKYGLEITADGYRFIAKNAAVVNNTVWFKYNYILINGKKGAASFGINFNDEEATVTNKYIGDFTAPFNAAVMANSPRWYALSNTFDLAEFFEGLGTAGKLKWIDAIARSMGNNTDANEINKAVFAKKINSTTPVYNVELLGGDPINNQATWDAAAYNGTLLNKYIRFDYVDATGATCLTGNIRDLDNIAGLKVTFLADSQLGHVQYPYYTVDNQKYNGQGVALPLDNAFRIEIATRYDQYEVARMNFSFELEMPTNCPIKRQSVGNQTTAWSKTEAGVDVLKIYGEKLDNKTIAGDLRDAFTGAFQFFNGAYNDKVNVEANWYKADIPTSNLTMVIMGKQRGQQVTLSDIEKSSVYTEWNTVGMYGNGALDESELVNVEYYHFNVYTEAQPNIILQFASKVADSQKAQVKSAGTTANPFVAKAVYNDDKTLNHYEFSVSNDNFTMTDAFDNAYSLFDSSSKLRANLHVKLLEDRQGIVIDKNAPSFYGLYPTAKVDGVTTNLVTYALNKPADAEKTVNMKISIDKTAGVDKVFEITYHVTDVFGCVKPVTFYVRTVNDAIGNDDEEQE